MKNSVKALVLIFLAAFIIAGLLSVHEFGRPAMSDVDDYYITFSQPETGSNSTVTPIVFDYRGFDTLGEATVLFTTVTAILAFFRGVKE